MNATRQALHILAKDIRGHALEIGLVLALNLVLVLTLTVTWADLQNPQRSPDYIVVLIGDAAQILLVVACIVLIGRVVQADGVAGKTACWLTRPYSRPALLASKLAFVLLFVHVPIFLSQLAVVTGSGVPLSLPQLLANQAVFVAVASLPLMALAALTTTFSRFVLGGVVLAPLSLPLFAVVFFESTNVLTVGARPILAVILVVALACQYHWRSTLRVAAWSLVALCLLGLGMLPPVTRFVSRARAAAFPPQAVASTIRLGDVPERGDLSFARPFVSLPLNAQITADTSIRRYAVEVHAADGRRVEIVGTGARLRFTPQYDPWLDLQFSPADYDTLSDSLVSVRFVVDFQVARNRETEPIPLDGSFAIVDGHSQCGLANRYQLACRTSLGGSYWSLDAPNAELRLLSSPQRLRFSLDPIVIQWIYPRPLPTSPWPGPSISTLVREIVSYTRQDVTFENIRLSDWRP